MERFAMAKGAGFEAVELLNPYDAPVQDMRDQLVWHDLKMALINCPPPNYTGGAPGYAAVTGSRFRQDFRRTLRYAQALKAEFIHVMAGQAEGLGAHETFVENLRWAVSEARAQKLTIEPLNPIDRPGYFLNDYLQAGDILAEVDAPNLALQFDAYHVQRIHGDVPSMWKKVQKVVAHVQVAQTPARDEPQAGEIDYPAFFEILDADGYAGWVSGEYRPKANTRAGLGWMS